MLDLTDWEKKKYTTRDGRPVRLLCVDAVGAWPIIGTLSDREEGGRVREYPYVWGAKGERGGFQGADDLINAKTKKEGWVNVFPGGTVSVVSYATKEQADTSAHPCRIACVKIEWEE